MSCTRRKESHKALVFGASGAELRMKLHDGTPARFLLPRGRFSFAPTDAGIEVDAWREFRYDGTEVDPPDSVLVTVLSDDATAAEVYS